MLQALQKSILPITAVLGAVLVPATGALASSPAPTTTTLPASAAAGWLAGQLAGPAHDHYQTVFGGTAYADDGNTADGVLGMDAAGVASGAATKMTAWLASDAVNYANGGGYTAHYYPGSIAKLMLVAEAQHDNVHAFGTLDLPKVLADQELSSGMYTNPDDTTYGPSTVAQALAVVGLSRTGNPADRADAKAVNWLGSQVCADGSFQFTVRTDPTTACTSADVDTTAFAIQGLLAAGSTANPSLTWLVAQEHSDGSFGTNASSAGNANSTALAIQALTAGGRSTAKALTWLRAQQVGCSSPASQRGAVRFQATFDATSALRATTQATQALAGKDLVSIDGTGASSAIPTLACASTVPGTKPVTVPTTNKKTVRNGAGSAVVLATTVPVALPMTGPLPVGTTAAVGGGLVLAGSLLMGVGRRRPRRH